MGLSFLLGSPLMASWINSALYAFGLGQALSVWDRLPAERWRMKLLLVFVVLIDTAAMVIVCAQTWIIQGSACVVLGKIDPNSPNGVDSATPVSTEPGGIDPATVTIQWSYPTVIALTGVTALMVHIFLLRRLWLLSRQLFMILPITALTIISFVGSVMTTAVVFRFPLLSDSHRWDLPSRLWEISSACTDIFLAVALIYTLQQVKSPFKTTKTLLRRLMLLAVETGATTSVVFIVVVVLLGSPRSQPIAVAFELMIGRFYTNTLLYNLQIGQRVWRRSSGTRLASASAPPINLSGIQFRRPRSTHHDGEMYADGGGEPSGLDTARTDSKARRISSLRMDTAEVFEDPLSPPPASKADHAV